MIPERLKSKFKNDNHSFFTLLRSTCHFDEVANIPEIFTSIHEIQESLSRMDSELSEVSVATRGIGNRRKVFRNSSPGRNTA